MQQNGMNLALYPGMMQTTLKRQISTSGIGLHNGQSATLTLVPSFSGKGIVFRRTDVGKKVEIPATPRFLQSTYYATRLARDGVLVETVEHVLAALYACGVDQAIVELTGPEVPSVDGSSEPFVAMIEQAGTVELQQPRKTIRILKPLTLLDGDKSIQIYPSRGFHVTYSIEFDHPLLAFQRHTAQITRQQFTSDIAPARTFGFLRDVEALRERGLARGGSLENAIVIAEDKILNDELRFENECVRHKILDLVGDFALMGNRVDGHVVVHKGGHHLHAAFLKMLSTRKDAYETVATRPESVYREPYQHPASVLATPEFAS